MSIDNFLLKLSPEQLLYGGMTIISVVLALSFIALLRYVFKLIFNHLFHNTQALTKLCDNVDKNTEFTKEAIGLIRELKK